MANRDYVRAVNAGAGFEGQPGSTYCWLSAILGMMENGRYELRVKASRGSVQQGCDWQEHSGCSLKVRGDTPDDCVAELADDVESWDEWLTPQERHQLLRDIAIEAEDMDWEVCHD